MLTIHFIFMTIVIILGVHIILKSLNRINYNMALMAKRILQNQNYITELIEEAPGKIPQSK